MLSSVNTALRVLEHVVDEGEAGISEISRSLDLTIGTVYRMVATLTATGYLEQNESNKRYRPGPKIPDLARRLRGSSDFVTLAHPYLSRLMAATGETVNMGVLRDTDIVYVDRVVTEHPLAVTVSIGSRVPAYCTALGRAILAYSDDDILQAYLERLPTLEPTGSAKPPSPKAFAKLLETVREVGFGEDNREFSPDIACVAAPVVDGQGVAQGAISVSVPSSRVGERLDDIIPMVQTTAKELSELYDIAGAGRIA